MELTRPQYKLLKRIKRKSLKTSDISDSDTDVLNYLSHNGYITYESVFESPSSLKKECTLIHISQKGFLAYNNHAFNIVKWLIPLIISVAALIVSIYSALKPSPPINVYVSKSMAIQTANVMQETSTGTIGYL